MRPCGGRSAGVSGGATPTPPSPYCAFRAVLLPSAVRGVGRERECLLFSWSVGGAGCCCRGGGGGYGGGTFLRMRELCPVSFGSFFVRGTGLVCPCCVFSGRARVLLSMVVLFFFFFLSSRFFWMVYRGTLLLCFRLGSCFSFSLPRITFFVGCISSRVCSSILQWLSKAQRPGANGSVGARRDGRELRRLSVQV